ncbi:hypothetical protein [Paenibacillus sp.]|uniref:hypothetical protein n=1 Tax=Paenibacillus sp. TaxID=58172 RepID=UPI0028ADC9DB|nr:hypothetical protein [Paenibacillus sp.]
MSIEMEKTILKVISENYPVDILFNAAKGIHLPRSNWKGGNLQRVEGNPYAPASFLPSSF